MRFVSYCLIALMLPLVGLAGGIDHVDISPSTLVNLAEGHSGSFMGGAVTADIFLNRSFALRTTVGYTKDRYYPADLDYSGSNYGLWLSLAPYAQLNVGDRLKPYLAILGTFSSGSSQSYSVQPVGMEQAPFARLQQDARRRTSYSFGASIGSKIRLAGPVHLYGEVSHFFYSKVQDDEVYFGPDNFVLDREFDFERNPTYLSVGLTYSILTKAK